MPELVWDRVEDRTFESGLDKGVLYLPDGTAVPWNGLTSVIEHFDKEMTSVYFDGMKINDLLTLGSFTASMKAVTYPDELVEVEGATSDRLGLAYEDQPPQVFGLCYRTQVGNLAEGEAAGYKLHIIYNVTAIPSDKTYATESDQPSLVEFEWTISAIPEEVPGFRPTAKLTIDSRKFDPWLLEELEAMFYGTTGADAALIPMPDLVTYINEWYRVKIVDNGDGTWTAISDREGFIQFGLNGYFEIVGVNALYLDDVTFQISDTKDIAEVPQISIDNLGNGLWSATTAQGDIITMLDETTFEIRNANVVWLSPTTYRITDTTDQD